MGWFIAIFATVGNIYTTKCLHIHAHVHTRAACILSFFIMEFNINIPCAHTHTRRAQACACNVIVDELHSYFCATVSCNSLVHFETKSVYFGSIMCARYPHGEHLILLTKENRRKGEREGGEKEED